MSADFGWVIKHMDFQTLLKVRLAAQIKNNK